MATTRAKVSSKQLSDAVDLERLSSGMMDAVESLRTGSKLFPGGITKVSLAVEVVGVGRIQLELDGPHAASAFSEAGMRGAQWSSVCFPAIEAHLAPPLPAAIPGEPAAGSASDQAKLRAGATIEGAAKTYASECAGGDVQPNNCAHYLSDAFIRAGLDELAKPEDCISNGGRCLTPAKRPIRARDMWCWFQKKALQSGGRVQRNTGIWAIFQLNESAYWGGHVAILDSNEWKYYGTGWYDDWEQHSYKW